jgi:hypothetical protein
MSSNVQAEMIHAVSTVMTNMYNTLHDMWFKMTEVTKSHKNVVDYLKGQPKDDLLLYEKISDLEDACFFVSDKPQMRIIDKVIERATRFLKNEDNQNISFLTRHRYMTGLMNYVRQMSLLFRRLANAAELQEHRGNKRIIEKFEPETHVPATRGMRREIFHQAQKDDAQMQLDMERDDNEQRNRETT